MESADFFHSFERFTLDGADAKIAGQRGGAGPPLLLLHGFPQTHLMWRDVATILAERFTVVAADLRGYGQSGTPASAPDHAPYSKRAMGQDMIAVMRHLGFDRFAVAGHDRGGRVAYRAALDHPGHITGLAVLDVLPVAEAWERAGKSFVTDFWPWSLLAQDAPLPERLIAAAPEAVIDDALDGWGSPPEAFPPNVRAAYLAPLRDNAHVHAICEEYRAAATIDHDHDRADRDAKRKIACPVLALWSDSGPLEKWYRKDGGPLAIWRNWARDVSGRPMRGGHFFPEESPDAVADELARFFSA